METLSASWAICEGDGDEVWGDSSALCDFMVDSFMDKKTGNWASLILLQLN